MWIMLLGPNHRRKSLLTAASERASGCRCGIRFFSACICKLQHIVRHSYMRIRLLGPQSSQEESLLLTAAWEGAAGVAPRFFSAFTALLHFCRIACLISAADESGNCCWTAPETHYTSDIYNLKIIYTLCNVAAHVQIHAWHARLEQPPLSQEVRGSNPGLDVGQLGRPRLERPLSDRGLHVRTVTIINSNFETYIFQDLHKKLNL